MEPINAKSRGRERLVTFRLGQELYGVEIRQIKEVVHFQEVREFTEGPDFILGAVWSRNRRIPVIDLKRRLGIDEATEGKSVVMILDTDPTLGVVIDGISRILNMDSRNYEVLPEETVGSREENCVERVAKTGEELVLIVTPGQILTRVEKDMLKHLGEGNARG